MLHVGAGTGNRACSAATREVRDEDSSLTSVPLAAAFSFVQPTLLLPIISTPGRRFRAILIAIGHSCCR